MDWHFPKNHWTHYLSNHFDVYKFGKYGADNYSILFQLGNLPKFNAGDRIIIVFSEPGRLPRRFYGERLEKFKLLKWMYPNYYKDKKFAEKLHNLKYDEGVRWINGERKDEINFLRNLKEWLIKYNPVFITWNTQFHKSTSDFVDLIQSTSIYEEGVDDVRDFHPGPLGCYDWYKKIHKLMGIDDHIVKYEEDIKNII